MRIILLAAVLSFGLISLTGCDSKPSYEEALENSNKALEDLKKLQEPARIELNKKYGLDANGKPLKKSGQS